MSSIMIVDDSPILRSTIRTVLERSGFNVAGEAGSAQEAFELFQKSKPDLVLLDILLPGESGLDILRELKRLDPAVKVLIVTAVNQDSVNKEARETGAKGILYKPFDPLELIGAIKTILADGN